MPLTIGSNISSLQAQRRLGEGSYALSTAFERLSSGQRINRASDDAAGLAIADSLNSRARVYGQALRNLEDGVSYLSVADGALQQLTTVSTRIAELAEQSANGIYSNHQRLALHNEAAALRNEYNRILGSTTFNGRLLFDTAQPTVRLQAGYGLEGSLEFSLGSHLTRLQGDGTFQTGVTFSSDFTGHLTIGDFNGDQKMDLVTVGGSAGRIQVKLGDGAGGFSSLPTFRTNEIAGSIETGDLNGNGKLDLLVSTNSALHVFTGNGDGTFTNSSTFAVSGGYSGTTLGDFNGDGIIDLAGSWTAGNGVDIFLGNGDGTFQAPMFSSVAGPTGLATGDIDGDGKADLITGRNGTEFNILYGNGDGTFTAPVTIGSAQGPHSIALGDVNNDGRLDIVARASQSLVHVYLNNGDGSFAHNQFTAVGNSGVDQVELGDLNGDGRLDIVTDAQNMGMVVLLGNGDGTFQARATYGNSEIREIHLADFNGDSVTDVIGATGSNEFILFLGNSSASFLLPEVNLQDEVSARNTLTLMKSTLEKVSSERSALGATQSRIAVAHAHLLSTRAAHLSAEAAIRDADIADESAKLIRTQIQQQMAAAVLAQANQQPAMALKLLSD